MSTQRSNNQSWTRPGPTELEMYFQFYPTLKAAVDLAHMNWARGRQGKNSIRQFLGTQNAELSRNYDRALSGHIKIINPQYFDKLLELITRHAPTADIERLKTTYSTYLRFAKERNAKNSELISNPHLTDKQISDRISNIMDSSGIGVRQIAKHPEALLQLVDDWQEVPACNGQIGEAVKNARALAEMLRVNKQSEFADLSEQNYYAYLGLVARSGAWASHLGGDWFQYNYFLDLLKLAADSNHKTAVVSYNCAVRHNNKWAKYNGRPKLCGSGSLAHVAFQTLPRDVFHSMYENDPILLFSPAAEEIDRGAGLKTLVSIANNTTVESMLDRADSCERTRPDSKRMAVESNLLRAKACINDKKFDKAFRYIIDAEIKYFRNVAKGTDVSLRVELLITKGRIEQHWSATKETGSLLEARAISLEAGLLERARRVDEVIGWGADFRAIL